MIRKYRILIFFLLAALLLFFGLVFRPAPALHRAAATLIPKTSAALTLQSQAGNSDGIVFLGILIFVFIAIPLLIRFRDLNNP